MDAFFRVNCDDRAFHHFKAFNLAHLRDLLRGDVQLSKRVHRSFLYPRVVLLVRIKASEIGTESSSCVLLIWPNAEDFTSKCVREERGRGEKKEREGESREEKRETTNKMSHQTKITRSQTVFNYLWLHRSPYSK